jgi:hypothetical protein
MAAAVLAAGAAGADNWSYRCVQTTEAPVIDGVIAGDVFWEEAIPIVINHSAYDALGKAVPVDQEGAANDSDMTATVYCLWDADNWYIAVEILDDDWRNRNDGQFFLNNTDSIMLWMDPSNADPNVNSSERTLITWTVGSLTNGTDEPRFSVLDYDDSTMTEDSWAVTHSPDGLGGTWRFEAALPWSGFDVATDGPPNVAIGGEIGISFAVHDWDRDPADPDNIDSDVIDVYSQYTGADPDTPKSWLNTDVWPTLYLVGPADATDSDGDGLSDVDEGVYGTDPNDRDSDDDGHLDEWEVASGTDPNDAQSVPSQDDPNPPAENLPLSALPAVVAVATAAAVFLRRK